MSTFVGTDGLSRCSWCSASDELRAYHDGEWGFPVGDDRRLFEKLCLEAFQSGLSWRTILAKREHFRAAFHGFDFERVARYGDRDIERLLADEGIVRHRGKIEAVINNARRAQELVAAEGSLGAFIWRFEPARRGAPATVSTTAESEALARTLKSRGWRFLGPTTAYAFMQSMGLVNDHALDCASRPQAEAARRRFEPPQAAAGAAP